MKRWEEEECSSLVEKERFPHHPVETSPLKTDKEIAHLDPT